MSVLFRRSFNSAIFSRSFKVAIATSNFMNEVYNGRFAPELKETIALVGDYVFEDKRQDSQSDKICNNFCDKIRRAVAVLARSKLKET